jgi:hypothetical protein
MVPFSETDTPINVSPVAASVTVPFISDVCPNTAREEKRNKGRINNIFQKMGSLFMIVNLRFGLIYGF